MGCVTTPTGDAIYQKQIFTDHPNQDKIKVGDVVTFRYYLKNGNQLIAGSILTTSVSTLTIPPIEQMNKFERPLLWLGLGDSSIVHVAVSNLDTELDAYKEHFDASDQATFIYKILDID